ncbi:hypothetical protein [Corallococcus exiguus]|uniref:Uncharacterized protein n=1 Tax=Corallococcus exiguus TaxID=83462 RepID=A0A7X5BZD6_9BACT|nr:hypothetical protein [Corallococcus exiguus]NBC46247.1 hypothetical protein [Corallococcus exiguus]TNV61278.1 hypothetical protein FH620_21770 [Corallococcus exiguus]
MSSITPGKQDTVNVNAAGVIIPVKKKHARMVIGGMVGGAGTASILLFTPLAPFALVGGMLGFGAGGLIGKAMR